MTIQHHPPEPLLTAYSAGTLDLGQHVAIATHAFHCGYCRRWIRAMEHVGGAMLEDLPRSPMADSALEIALMRLDAPATSSKVVASLPDCLKNIPGLPDFVRRYPAGEWQWIAPRLYMRSIPVKEPTRTRVFLLKAGAAMQLLRHAHSGLEMTCVLTGSFSHDGLHYGPGDFDLGDPDIEHEISIGTGEECICLVAMQGELRLKGLLGRLMQPFVPI
jgi:putative transcriptional regulator